MDRPTTARRTSGRRRGAGGPAPLQLTSLPTHRGAYKDTREWLLERHGSVCAYCGQKQPEELLTPAHLTPRRARPPAPSAPTAATSPPRTSSPPPPSRRAAAATPTTGATTSCWPASGAT